MLKNKQDQISCEMLTLTYGAMVAQVIKDYENIQEVNQQLEAMGYNIGKRIIDEYLARNQDDYCKTFSDTANSIAVKAFKMFLGVEGEVQNMNNQTHSFSIVLKQNPLTDFVQLPSDMKNLNYSNILCGAIKGALEMIHLNVECKFIRDILKGDEYTEIQVKLIEHINKKIELGD